MKENGKIILFPQFLNEAATLNTIHNFSSPLIFLSTFPSFQTEIRQFISW